MLSRSEAVPIARSWLGTLYVKGGRIKGAGCDCGTLLAEYLIEIGRATAEELAELGFYSHDWFLHTNIERYLRHLMRYGKLVAEAKCSPGNGTEPGNIALYRSVNSRIYNHGAIITEWPFGVHAADGQVRESNLTTHRLTGWRQMCVFDPFVTLDSEAHQVGKLHV